MYFFSNILFLRMPLHYIGLCSCVNENGGHKCTTIKWRLLATAQQAKQKTRFQSISTLMSSTKIEKKKNLLFRNE